MAKPAGAYRPPGARGNATPSIFKREDEGGTAFRQDGYSTPPRSGQNGFVPGRNGSPAPPNGQGQAPRHNHNQPGGGVPRTRHVPGAPPPQSGNPNPTDAEQKKARKRSNPKKEKKAGDKEKQKEEVIGSGSSSANPSAIDPPMPPPPAVNGARAPRGSGKAPPALNLPSVPFLEPSSADLMSPLDPMTPGGEGLDPLAKKIRNLNKKVSSHRLGSDQPHRLLPIRISSRPLMSSKTK